MTLKHMQRGKNGHIGKELAKKMVRIKNNIKIFFLHENGIQFSFLLFNGIAFFIFIPSK
jgi:hypothetical protein